MGEQGFTTSGGKKSKNKITRARQQQALELSKQFLSILEQEELFRQIVNRIQESFAVPFVFLFSVHSGRRKIFLEASSPTIPLAPSEPDRQNDNPLLSTETFAFELDDPHGLIPWAARQGEITLVNDVSLDPRCQPAPIFPDTRRAELAIPLIFSGQILGVLDLQSDQEHAFGPDELSLFTEIARDIAIAMRNAGLYRSERWRRQVADSLRSVAGLLSAEVGLDEVLNAVLRELENNLPCDLAAVWFLEEDHGEEDEEQNLPSLRLAAVRGVAAAWLAPQVGLNLEEILEIDTFGQATRGRAALPGWLFEAMTAAEPVIRSGQLTQDAFGEALAFPENYSALASSLHIADKRLGLLIIAHPTAGCYGSEARDMTAVFASQASVAIQNTRLYEAAHEQLWVSTVMLQLADATQSLDDLNELIAAVAQLTPLLVGVKACAIYLTTPEGIFYPASAAGLDPAGQLDFERSLFTPSDVPVFDRLWNERRAAIILRQGEDLRLARFFPPHFARGETLEILAIAPLIAHGELHGALIVQYAGNPFRSNIQDLEDFFEDKLSILQGIAHQTATAIENLQLLKSQKEEAYISVALLQVAQAIVSSNEIQETLGTITRITPILTGFKRVAFFLYDHQAGVFHLAETYGMPRSADTYPIGLDDFPFLEAACNRAEIIAYPLNPNPDDEWEDVPEIWTYLPAPDPDEVAEFIASETRLLIAFPLTVKGRVLGALVVEEPEPSRSQQAMTNLSNLRLRSKRVEITTGISRQAALAIQNDQLQQDMLERERLAREMQLAREIQRAFLPERLPNLPGWEFNVWWRTASEMAGDFYDLFELPGNRLGIVMADVADKGMQAALFMILTRALLRASVIDDASPAVVLSRVNDLLVPDAQGGTFVTLLYALLDPESGQLTYANAGHNPPIWVRTQTRTSELLRKSGMALGVLEGIIIEERSLVLAPGDFLAFYTDGVTETFSPEGQIFGSDRLEQAILDSAFSEGSEPPSAANMLAAIDAAVETFTAGASPIDDSTMLILHWQGG